MAFKTISTGDQNLQLIQSNVQAALSPIQASPFINGKLLSNVTLNSGMANAVPHGLGRIPTLYFITLQSANGTIWNAAAMDSKYIYLNASVTMTANIWVG